MAMRLKASGFAVANICWEFVKLKATLKNPVNEVGQMSNNNLYLFYLCNVKGV